LDAARYGWQGLSAVNPVGSAAYVCQIAVVYFFSFLSKTGESWRNGEAVGLVLQLDQYTSRLGAQVLSYPGLLEWLTWFTLGIELIAPLLLLVPKMKVRIFGVLMLGVMQIGFAVLMELGLFPFVSLIALIPFLRVQREANLKTQGRFESRRLVLWREGLALVCLGIMLLWNIGVSRVEFQRTRLKSILPGPLVGVVERLRLDQSWSMFSPDPPVDDGWLVFEGTLSSGQQVDLRSPQNGLSWEKPENVSSSFLGDRWKAYLLNLVQRGLSWRSMAEFLVAEWDESHSTEQKIAALRITYMKEQTLSLGHSSVEKITLFEMEEEEPISE
ncbi:MAG: HTTM domain-containing protein, partial [Verrucomicrobia bacterium]|nr:HTTM domain-containing protein [Verrucomicrobiota bacterium]